jgi:hypothetical protein
VATAARLITAATYLGIRDIDDEAAWRLGHMRTSAARHHALRPEAESFQYPLQRKRSSAARDLFGHVLVPPPLPVVQQRLSSVH